MSYWLGIPRRRSRSSKAGRGTLPLQHQQLVTQRQDLRIATIAAGQQQPDTGHDETDSERQRPRHDR